MTVEEFKSSRISVTQPPRTLDVQKFAESRASELESLHSIVANRLNNDFRSQRNKRRRTTGHDNRLTKKKVRKRRKLGLIDEVEPSASDKDQKKKKVPRRVLRRIELTSNPERGFCTTGDGTKRLRTHLWHAKRFLMAKRWGFYLPQGLQGRGKGSRALLRLFENGALVHDASYLCAVQLEGPENSLLSILRMVLVPTRSVCLEELSTSVLSGVCYGSAMLHHVGAPFSQLIAPVTYMWRPLIKKDIEIEAEKVSIPAGSSTTCSSTCDSPFRKLWLWIHAAAYSEGFDALRCASQKQMDESHESSISVNCFPLEGQLAKLEVMGSKAVKVLQKILCPVFSETSEGSLRLTKCTALEDSTETQIQKSLILEHAQHLPSGAILSLTVKDPRDLPKKGIESVSEAQSTTTTTLEGDVQVNNSDEPATLTEFPDKNKEIISSLWSKTEANSVLLSDSKDLWNIQNVLNPPVEENLLCMEKHQRRMAFYNLDNTNSGVLSSESMKKSSRSCPILLLKDNDQRGSCARVSVILPLSWVKAFWVPLLSSGARAIGFREKHQIACDVGLPSFPFDFPDCKAYSSFMANEAAVSDKKLELRPPAMRPPRVPIPPPWDSVRFAIEEGLTSDADIQASREKVFSGEKGLDNSLVDTNIKSCDSTTLERDDSFFEGLIARTSNILTDYLSEIHGGHLLLFPSAAATRKKVFAEMLNIEGKVSQKPKVANQILVDRKLCFLRVHLCAYKEGVFEEGAVICSPRLSDLSLWVSRSDDQEEGGLQIPQSSIRSYYTQQPSGKWELQKPEDPVARESHRRPIGFVTTGFVRGSGKPVAEAFCEASSLAELRREQWEGMERNQKEEQEIFVVVRNLRSAAYRLALATIVLEQQEEDVEFM
ncbi:Ribonuclease P/MRP [Macleaya cordata]|uniref:Ribonuclease P/MRP n=1 Tax=Macleaya cordata TaxID=56857 RepID=A0A200PWG3_MACCD|nr:Ribonuclease P/MRP [Macleaya cordata]